MAHGTSFLFGQRDVIASFSFGTCTVKMEFCQLSEVEEFCENTATFNFILDRFMDYSHYTDTTWHLLHKL